MSDFGWLDDGKNPDYSRMPITIEMRAKRGELWGADVPDSMVGTETTFKWPGGEKKVRVASVVLVRRGEVLRVTLEDL